MPLADLDPPLEGSRCGVGVGVRRRGDVPGMITHGIRAYCVCCWIFDGKHLSRSARLHCERGKGEDGNQDDNQDEDEDEDEDEDRAEDDDEGDDEGVE